ncbi:hypothetical protein JCM10207_003633 [Rhodosporidiobolus poonsookiae]
MQLTAAALVLLPAVLAAPLARRNGSAPSTCRLELNQTMTTQIRHSIDTRSAWVPIENDKGENVSVQVNTLSTTSYVPFYWNVVPAANGTHKVQLAANTTQCVSGSGTGQNATLANFVSCDSEEALFDITCTTCTPTLGGDCHFTPHVDRRMYIMKRGGNPAPTIPTLCATVPSEQYGDMTFEECQEFTTPPQYEQLFYFGQR